MTTKIFKRAIPPAVGTSLKPSVEALTVAVNELGGAIGQNAQRAVRVCELLDAGIMRLDVDGALIANRDGDDARYVKRTGDTMTGQLVLRFNGAQVRMRSIVTANANANFDIGQNPTGGPADNDGYIYNRVGGIWFGTANTFRGQITAAGNFNFAGEFQSTFANGLRLANNARSLILRNDGNASYFLLTNAGDPYGTWNALRPFTVANDTGVVTLGHGVVVTAGDVRATAGNITAAAGAFVTEGPSAALFFQNRGALQQWAWYCSANITRLWNGGADIMTADSAGNFSALNFTSTSDRSEKRSIRPLAPRHQIEKLMLKMWVWKATGLPGLGVVAQDVQRVAPQYVYKNPESGKLSVDKAGLALEMAMLALKKLGDLPCTSATATSLPTNLPTQARKSKRTR